MDKIYKKRWGLTEKNQKRIVWITQIEIKTATLVVKLYVLVMVAEWSGQRWLDQLNVHVQLVLSVKLRWSF